MLKINIFSVFSFNFSRRFSKKYLSFFFMTVAIFLCYGFLFTTKIHAEEEVINTTEVSEVPIIITTEEAVAPTEVSEVPATIITKEVVTPTIVSSDIGESGATWKKDGSPYLVINSILVKKGATLTIEPNVVVKFDNGATLTIDGKIEAQGTNTLPIYFTSIYDDEIGGDINKDHEDFEDCYYDSYDDYGNGIGDEICKTADLYEPSEGDWGYILIESLTEQSILNNVIQRYSDDGLILYNGGSVISDNFNSDQGVSAFGSDSTFNHLIIPFISLYAWDKIEGEVETRVGSTISIDGQSEIINDNGFSIMVEEDSSITIKNSKMEGVGSYPISIFSNSSAIFDTVEISNGTVGVWENSSLEINNSSVTNNNGNGFEIFDDSSLDATNLSVECKKDGISVFSNSSLNLSEGSISCIDHGIYVFNESKADINNIKISGALGNVDYYGVGLIAHGNTGTNGITIKNSEITGNKDGFIVYGSPISAHQNSIHDNTVSGATTYDGDPATNLDFSSNFWGDKTGPTHPTNPTGTGLGDVVSDDILFTPFLKFDPTKNIRHPVILIPGITGTYLNRNYGDKDEIWPDILKLMSPLDPFDSYLNDLALNIDGTEDTKFPITPGGIIGGIATVHVFDRLIEDFTNAGYIEGTDLFMFPYDWRMSTKSNAILLKNKIDKIISDTGQEKIDIVAHSMGGLIAKKYIINNGEDKIDQLIFLGTPQLGSPKAFKTLMFGDQMGYKFLILGMNQLRAKYISQNMPSVYELLPSFKYIQENGNYVVDAFHELIGAEPISLDYLATKNLMIDTGRNSLMFPFAEELHDSIDKLDLSGIKSYNFVGCGSKTIGEIKVKQKRGWEKLFLGLKDDFDLKYINGDETVPVVSANKAIGSELYYVKGISHGDLPSASGVKENVLAILTGKDKVESPNLVSALSTCNISGNVVSTHSPVDLHIYDEEGNHTGFDANGDIEYGIPGVQYDVLDEVKYAFLPYGINYKIVTKATDTGGYNFKIEEQDKNDIITDTYKWNLIPLSTLQTTGEIWVGPDYSPANYEVKIDKDGDGVIDSNYAVSYDGASNAEKIISESLNRNHSSGYIKILPYQNINTVTSEQIVNKSDELVEKHEEVSNFRLESIKEGDIIKNEIKEDEKYKNSILTSAGSVNFKIKGNTLLVIIGGSILVILLAIKFIFKLK